MTNSRSLVLLASSLSFLALSGCSDRRENPTYICDKRDVMSGTCTESHYVCTAPMKLYRQWGGPICAMNAENPNEFRMEKAE